MTQRSKITQIPSTTSTKKKKKRKKKEKKRKSTKKRKINKKANDQKVNYSKGSKSETNNLYGGTKKTNTISWLMADPSYVTQ